MITETDYLKSLCYKLSSDDKTWVYDSDRYTSLLANQEETKIQEQQKQADAFKTKVEASDEYKQLLSKYNEAIKTPTFPSNVTIGDNCIAVNWGRGLAVIPLKRTSEYHYAFGVSINIDIAVYKNLYINKFDNFNVARVYNLNNISRNLTIPTSYNSTYGGHTDMGYAFKEGGSFPKMPTVCECQTFVLINKDHTYMWFYIESQPYSINIDPLCVAITNV